MQNNFEKQVQQKMDELRFEPPPPVWQKVALQIQTEKKRRRLFIWLPVLALLIAGGIWWMVQLKNSTAGISKNTQQRHGVQQPKTAETILPSQAIDHLSSEQNATTQKINQLPFDKNASPKKTDYPVAESNASIEKSEPVKENVQLPNVQLANTAPASITNPGSATQQKNVESRNPTKRLANSVGVKNSVTDEVSNAEKKLTNVADERLETVVDKTVVTGTGKKLIMPSAATQTEIKKDNQNVVDNVSSKKIELAPRGASEGRQQKQPGAIIKQPVSKDSIVFQKIASAIKPDTTAVAQTTIAIQLPGRNKWQLQINAAAGITGLSNGINLFGGLFSGEKSMTDAGSFLSSQSAPPTASRAPSTIRNGLGFSIGASAEKEISKRLSFSAGLQYNYYSTSIAVGQLTRQDSVVRNSVQLNQFYANSGAGFSNKINSYNFLSVPVSLHWQVNKKLPLYIKAGFSVQQMVAANAVLYDAASNIYYTDNNALKKTQTFLHMAITWRVVSSKKFSMQLGPQLQYGLSQLEKNNSGNHLFTASIGTQISFSGK